MKKYLFAIYPKELRKEDFDQIGDLCPGVTIEELDEDAIEAIIFAFYMTHNAAQHGHCYRFKTDELLPALFMVEKTPAYIGLFNVKDERACTTMGVSCPLKVEPLLWFRGGSLGWLESGIRMKTA